MSQIFAYSRKGCSLSFQLPRCSYNRIIVRIEEDTDFSYQSTDPNVKTKSTTTLVPLLLPAGHDLPPLAVETQNDFYLRDVRVVMIHWNHDTDWHTSDILAKSERHHRRDFPRERSRSRSPNERASRIISIEDEKPEGSVEASSGATASQTRVNDVFPFVRRFDFT